jgi:hypothetical protein
MLEQDKFKPVRKAIQKGLDKLRKWYMTLDDSDTYFICLSLIFSFFLYVVILT